MMDARTKMVIARLCRYKEAKSSRELFPAYDADAGVVGRVLKEAERAGLVTSVITNDNVSLWTITAKGREQALL